MTSPEDELRRYHADSRRLAARYAELRGAFSYRASGPLRLIERTVKSARKRKLSQNAHRILGMVARLLSAFRVPMRSLGLRPTDGPTAEVGGGRSGNQLAVSGSDQQAQAGEGAAESLLHHYREEVARLSAKCEGLRSTTSYRLAAPIRIVERALRSSRKRPLRQNLARAAEDIGRWFVWGGSDERNRQYNSWIRRKGALTESDVARIRAEVAAFPERPLISVIVLPGEAKAGETWRSLEAQVYPHFEVLGVEAVTRPSSLRTRQINSIETEPAHLFNAALSMAQGAFCICLSAGDVLTPHALYLFVSQVIKSPDVDLIYGDEDVLHKFGGRYDPFFKPDWNPELLHAFDYVGRAAIMRTSAVYQIGGARAVAGVAWRWDLSLRLTLRDTKKRAVANLRGVVISRVSPTTDHAVDEASAFRPLLEEVLAEHLFPAKASVDGRGWLVVTPSLPRPPPSVSIIIPTRDKVDMLARCLASICDRTDYPDYSIHVVDNGSIEQATFAYYNSIGTESRITIHRDPGPFNYAAIHNHVVPQTAGAILAFLNNDVEVESPSWLAVMTGFAVQPDIGIVGARLHFPDGRIQHAGVMVDGSFSLLHSLRGEPRDILGPRGIAQISREVQAVTGACMVMRRSVFDEVGGFDEAFAVNFNDIDLCMRTTGRGYRIVLAATAALIHLESATRGKTNDGRALAKRERDLFRARWQDRVRADPEFRSGATGLHDLEFGSWQSDDLMGMTWRERAGMNG